MVGSLRTGTVSYLCISLRTSHGIRYTEEMPAKYLKSKHLKTKPPATSSDWSKVEISKKRVKVMGYVMCCMNFTALMEKLGMH